MSGGSYRYLCAQFASDLIGGNFDEELQRMADSLARRGYTDAAAETLEVMLESRQARMRIQTRVDRLTAIWKEVEWEEDDDGGDIPAAIAKYRGESS